MATLRLGGATMKNWVVLFARTGTEERLVRTLKEKLDAGGYLPFVPTKEMPYRSRSVVYKIRKPLFPGYVFIQTEVEPSLIVDKLDVALKGIKDIYSILHYGDDKKDVMLREGGRLYWEHLFDADFCVVASVGFIEIINMPQSFPNLNYVVSTNGSILNKDIFRHIVGNDWLVCVSIHGLEDTHNVYTKSNNFNNVVRFIDMLSGRVRMHILLCIK